MTNLLSKIAFATEGSIIDSISRAIPNFSRLSPITLHEMNDGQQSIEIVGAGFPAFYPSDQSFLIDPGTTNILTFNADLTNQNWVRGGSVAIKANATQGVAQGFDGDVITWTGGVNQASQTITRSFNAIPGANYTLSLLVGKTATGQFGNADVISITGNVVGTPIINLATLNANPDQYQYLSLSFQASGATPALPAPLASLPILAVGAQSLTVGNAGIFNAGDLVGARISFSSLPGQYFNVTGNTLNATDGSVALTLDSSFSGIIAGSVALTASASSSTASILMPLPATVALNFCSFTTASLKIAGIQIEQRSFPTPMIFQKEYIVPRLPTSLYYQPKDNPLYNSQTGSVYIELSRCVGDGNIFSVQNFRVAITNGHLTFTINSSVLTDPDPIPKGAVNIFCQIAAETALATVYVNGVLKVKATVVNFVGARAIIDLASNGVRAFKRLFIFNTFLTDGQPPISGPPGGEVGGLFANPNLLVNVDFEPKIILASVSVPAAVTPPAATIVQAIAISSNSISVGNSGGFTQGATITIVRNSELVGSAIVTNVAAGTLTLDSLNNINVGDKILVQSGNSPGWASVRFPYVPIEVQQIIAVDNTSVSSPKIQLNSTLAFNVGQAAYIFNSVGQDICEVNIVANDTINRWLTISNSVGVVVGLNIAQPESETLIDACNYLPGILSQNYLVEAGMVRSSNGIFLNNFSDRTQEVTPCIEIPAY